MIKGKKFIGSSLDDREENVVIYESEEIPPFAEGFIDTPIGKIRKIKTTLDREDKLDGYKARWGINRDNYKVSTGLYAVGNPNENSPLLVTANYKFTFDKLRVELSNKNLWIMVIDTKGINVWCAAGKGTFGNAEIINKIKTLQVNKVVKSNIMILPQLCATGVAAHIITRVTGFKVIYGPIRATDVKEFLANNFTATKEMREVKFDFMDRLVLTPIEIMVNLKYIPIILGVFFLLNLINIRVLNINGVLQYTILNSTPYISSLFIGAFLVPVLLPYIPFRAFSLKGLVVGIVWSIVTIKLRSTFGFGDKLLINIGNTLVLTTIISYLSLSFTGSTTYTSLSGVDKETRKTIPIALGAAVLGLIIILWNYISVLFS